MWPGPAKSVPGPAVINGDEMYTVSQKNDTHAAHYNFNAH